MIAESAYVDTSVLDAYNCREPLSAAAENALRQIKTPVISNLSEVEFSSLITMMTADRDLAKAAERHRIGVVLVK